VKAAAKLLKDQRQQEEQEEQEEATEPTPEPESAPVQETPEPTASA